MLGLRLAEGVDRDLLDDDEQLRAEALVRRGLLRHRSVPGRPAGYALTEPGRLLADGVVVEVLG